MDKSAISPADMHKNGQFLWPNYINSYFVSLQYCNWDFVHAVRTKYSNGFGKTNKTNKYKQSWTRTKQIHQTSLLVLLITTPTVPWEDNTHSHTEQSNKNKIV